MATLPGAWRHRVSAGTGLSGAKILWLGEVESLIYNYNFYLSVAARKIVWADPSLRYTIACCWDIKQASNQPNNPSFLLFFPSFPSLIRCFSRSIFIFIIFLSSSIHNLLSLTPTLTASLFSLPSCSVSLFPKVPVPVLIYEASNTTTLPSFTAPAFLTTFLSFRVSFFLSIRLSSPPPPRCSFFPSLLPFCRKDKCNTIIPRRRLFFFIFLSLSGKRVVGLKEAAAPWRPTADTIRQSTPVSAHHVSVTAAIYTVGTVVRPLKTLSLPTINGMRSLPEFFLDYEYFKAWH